MAVSQEYMASLLRRAEEGTLTEQQYQNYLTNLENGAFSAQQTAALSNTLPVTTTNTSFEQTPYNPQTPQADYSVQAYLDGIGWNPETGRAANGDTAQDIAFNLGLNGIDGGGFGFDEGAIGSYFNNMLPTNNPPATNGMGADGAQDGITTNAPVGNDGADVTSNPDYFAPFEPNWDTGGSIRGDGGSTPYDGGSGGFDWNWSDFDRGAPSLDGGGGYDPNDYAFDRYVPGQESPWGISGIEGGNKDFYRNQFMNLLRQEQNFQNKQRDAAMIREDAAANPIEAGPADWSWIEGGLPNVATGGGPADWQLRDGLNLEAGMTNEAVFNQVRDQLTPQTVSWYENTWNANEGNDSNAGTRNSTLWSYANSPNDFGAAQGAGLAAQQDLANALFQDINFSTAPQGYASPVDGLGSGRGNFGYQQGGATSFFNPLTGAWTGGAGSAPAGGTGGGMPV